jgi:hypothetical protein
MTTFDQTQFKDQLLDILEHDRDWMDYDTGGFGIEVHELPQRCRDSEAFMKQFAEDVARHEARKQRAPHRNTDRATAARARHRL